MSRDRKNIHFHGCGGGRLYEKGMTGDGIGVEAYRAGCLRDRYGSSIGIKGMTLFIHLQDPVDICAGGGSFVIEMIVAGDVSIGRHRCQGSPAGAIGVSLDLEIVEVVLFGAGPGQYHFGAGDGGGEIQVGQCQDDAAQAAGEVERSATIYKISLTGILKTGCGDPQSIVFVDVE